MVMALEGEGGRVTRYESVMAAVPGVEDMRYAERLLKMLLWARGGWRVLVAESDVQVEAGVAGAGGGARRGGGSAGGGLCAGGGAGV